MSKSLQRLFLPQVANASKTPLAKLLSSPDPVVKHFDKIHPISQAIQAEKYQRAVSLCQSLPLEIRNQKTLLIMHVGAAQHWAAADASPVAEQAYRQSLYSFRSHFGDDPAFLVLGIDYYVQLKDFAAAYEAIDKLDKAVGGDPYLDLLRGTTLFEEGQLDESLKMLRRAAEIEPDIEDPYWGLVNVHLARNDFAAVAEGLDELVDRFGYEMELESAPEYEAFRNSAIGEAWVQEHEGQK